MEAIRSLKIARISNGENLKHNQDEINIEDGLIKKQGCAKKP